MKNPCRSLDNILSQEFREGSKITGKKYYKIKKYYHNLLNKDFGIKSEEYYTAMDYQEEYGNIMEIALAYARDYVWFDEKII